MLVKGWPAGRNGAEVAFGSTRLISSTTDGSRHPFRPPPAFFAQRPSASLQGCATATYSLSLKGTKGTMVRPLGFVDPDRSGFRGFWVT